MTEPTYEYVKGQGWVVTSEPTSITVSYHGKTVHAYLRRPKLGEFYYYNHIKQIAYRNQFRDNNGKFLFEKFVHFFAKRDLGGRETPGVVFRDHHCIAEDADTVVFVADQ